MSDLAEADSRAPQLLRDRDRSGAHRVTNIELFFDLVYVFAVTQLSHYLLHHATVTGALQAGLLLVALMLISLAMSASLPRAFEGLGLWIGGAYAVQQIGRTVFMVIALRGHPLEANFQRILAWAAPVPRTGPSRAATSPSAARRSS